jgi:L-ascorbate metabolism protein UlaG (beta-lactamase superfamily)
LFGLNWRTISDFIKHRDWPLRIADRLGRGRGRLRLDDWYAPPPRAPVTPDLAGWKTRSLSAVWIGHATVLLRIGGKTLLTDPVFSSRIGLGFGLFTAGPRRFYRPAIPLSELPSIDAILISHAHFDHLDRPTLARMSRRVPVIASTHLTDLLADMGFTSITEIAWGESTAIGDVRVTSVPVHHWGARTFLDRHRGYGAFLIESASHRVLFGADTAYHQDWRGIGNVDLAIVGIGAYEPYIAAHSSPEQAWEMATRHLNARTVLPMHHSTFKLSHEPMYEPIQRFLRAAGDQAGRIAVRRIGETFTR